MSERYIVKSGKFGAFFFDTQAEPGRGDMGLYDVLGIMNNTPPPGYALVPIEPTPKMLADAGPMEGFDCEAYERDVDRPHIEWWKAMIKAMVEGE